MSSLFEFEETHDHVPYARPNRPTVQVLTRSYWPKEGENRLVLCESPEEHHARRVFWAKREPGCRCQGWAVPTRYPSQNHDLWAMQLSGKSLDRRTTNIHTFTTVQKTSIRVVHPATQPACGDPPNGEYAFFPLLACSSSISLSLSLAPLFLSFFYIFLFIWGLGRLVSDQGIGRITRSRERRSFTLSFVDIGRTFRCSARQRDGAPCRRRGLFCLYSSVQ